MIDVNVPALTVCQPYATLIADGSKPIENRDRVWRYRGGLWIHAGKSRKMLMEHQAGRRADLPFGAIVAHAELYACVHVDRLPPALADHEHAYGPWCLLLRNVVRLKKPVPCDGKLGLWRPEPLTLAFLREQLEAA